MKRLFNLSVIFVLLLGFIPQSTAIAEVLPLWDQLPDGPDSVDSYPSIEPTCLTRVVVGNTNNSDAGSLRQAIADVCANGTITFDSSLTGTTITLTSQLTLDKNVTIDGSDLASMVSVSGDNATRVMKVNEGVTATLKSFRISHGNFGGNGIGIYNSGTLTLDTMTLFDNLSTDLFGFGGGVFNNGTLTVNNSSFSSNSAYNGGAIYSEGTLSIVDSNLYENSATYGGVIYNSSSVDTLDIENSSLTGNSAAQSGGGIYNSYGGTAALTGCSISANTASDGGGISINSGGSLTVNDSTFSGNTASTFGGGIIISTGGSASVSGSTFLNNSAVALGGGGIQNFGTITVVNSTFTGNVTSESVTGSAINNGYGGVLTLYHSTLSGNAGWVTLYNNNASLSMANTIIANTINGWDCSIYDGTLAESINNWVEDGGSGGDTCGAALFGDPQLGSLADNGGPTQTLALLESSGAIDAADDTICAGELVGGVDQRGATRPYGSHCDIGAYEWGAEITGSLRISKVFDPLTSGFTGTFTIFYDCGGEYWAYTSLSAGGSVTFDDIPIGSQCTVTETTLPTAPNGWSFGTPTFSPEDGKVVIGETIAEVTITNTIEQPTFRIFLPLIIKSNADR